MATPEQIAANRLNAQRSTGPRSAEGKAVSRWNATKHGVLSRAVIPPCLEPYESRADFDALLADLREDLAPLSVIEDLFVQRIAVAYWRLSRLLNAEAGAIARRQASPGKNFGPHGSLDTILGIGHRSVSSLYHRVVGDPEVLNKPQALRQILAEYGSQWEERSLQEIREAAELLRRQLPQFAAQEEAEADIQRAQASLPALEASVAFARYESALERHLHRALHALERLQRLRAGEAVPPPLQVDLDIAASPPPTADEEQPTDD